MANEHELRIIELAEGIAVNIRELRAADGDLTSLQTTDTSSLVNAINEVASLASGGSDLSIGTNNTLTLELVSSNGDNQVLSGATALLAGLMIASDKIKLDGIQDGATVNDTDANLLNRANHTGTQTVSTISDFAAEVNALISGVVNGAPAALDTLDELAAAIGDDANFATTITTALGNRVRFDAPQTLTAVQRLQACENIGVGNPDRDFLAAYVAVRDA